MNLTIRMQLVLGFGIILSFLTILGSTTFVMNRQSIVSATVVSNDELPSAVAYLKLINELDAMYLSLLNHQMGDQAAIASFQSSYKQFQDQYQTILQRIHDPAGKNRIATIKTLVDQFATMADNQVLNLYQPEQERKAVEQSIRLKNEITRPLGVLLQKLLYRQFTATQQALRQDIPIATHLAETRNIVELNFLSSEMQQAITAYLSGDATQQKHFATSAKRFSQVLDAQVSTVNTPKTQEDLNAVKKLFQALQAEGSTIFTQFDSTARLRATSSIRDMKSGIITKLANLIDIAALNEVNSASQALRKLISSMSTVNFVAAAITIASLILGACITWWMTARLNSQLHALRDFAGKVALGDLNASLRGTYPGELDSLRQAIERMVANLKERLGYAQGIMNGISSRFPVVTLDAEGSITFINQMLLQIYGLSGKPETYQGKQLGTIIKDGTDSPVSEALIKRDMVQSEITTSTNGKEFILEVTTNPVKDLDNTLIGVFSVYYDLTPIKNQQRAIEKQNTLMAEIAQQANDIADQVSSGAEKLATQITETTERAQRQSSRTAETATAMEEMSMTVGDVARNASEASRNASAAHDSASDGEQIVEQTINAIREVHSQMDSLRNNMDKLGKQAQGIGNVINVIEDIADQTNLLALNAAIEAARAGDAGRGFAVVADEVRKLAEKTMSATREVAQAIISIQQGAEASITATGNATESVDSSTRLAHSSGEMLRQIVTVVADTAKQVESIAAASEEQSTASGEVSMAVEDINAISRETAEAMKLAREAVSSMAYKAQDLKKIIMRLSQ